MKRLILLSFLSFTLFASCEKDPVEDPPGTPTTIKGNVFDHFRNIPIQNFKVKLIKYNQGSPGFIFGGGGYTKDIATTTTDANGNYTINFGYYLKGSEKYLVIFEETSPYYIEFVDENASSQFVEGAENTIDVNAWEPVKVKFNLTVLNNHTPPLNTGIRYNDRLFGTNSTYETEPNESFELYCPPNSDVTIQFWYNENYTTSAIPIMHRISFPYTTGSVSSSDVLNYTIDCNTF